MTRQSVGTYHVRMEGGSWTYDLYPDGGSPVYGAEECASRHVADRHARQALRDMERDLDDEPSLDDDEPDFSGPIDGSPEDIDRRIDEALYDRREVENEIQQTGE